MADANLARAPPIVDFRVLQRRSAPVPQKPKGSTAVTAPDDERIQLARRAVQIAFSREKTHDDPKEPANANLPTYRQPQPKLRANTASLTQAEMEKAQMVRASKTYYKQGLRAAQAEIDASTLRGWRIDPELSTTEGLVLEKAGATKVAYRGTDWSNPKDVFTNAAGFAGLEEEVATLRSAKLQLRQIEQKYRALPTELLGYSKGGAHALTLGDRFRIPSTSFNPFVGKQQLTTESTVPHTIIRTVEDPVSSALALAKGKKNFTVKAIDPIVDVHVRSAGMKSTHALKNFTSAGKRQPGGIEQLTTKGVRMGEMLAHFETLDAMATGVEAGKSFTQTLDDFNKNWGARQRVDVTEEGKLGPRIHKESGSVKYWQDAGGAFTADEMAHLRDAATPPPREYSAEARAMGVGTELTPAQRAYVSELTPLQRTTFMRAQRTQLQDHIKSMNAAVQPHHEAMRALMPKSSTLGAGVVSSLVASAVMNVIDPDHRINRVASEGLEGATAGAFTTVAASALGTSAALGPEMLAGAAAYVAGAESSRAITSALQRGGMDRATAEALGGISGGGIGGVTAAVTGTASALAASMLFGAEFGEALGIVGGPVGMAIGTAVGGSLGGIIGGLGVLFGSHHNEPHNSYLLQPFMHEGIDSSIGTDAEIAKLIDDFNAKADYSDDAVTAIEAKITTRVRLMAEENGWGHGYAQYKATMNQVPRHYKAQDYAGRSSKVLAGDYAAVLRHERVRRDAMMADAQRRHEIAMNQLQNSTTGLGAFLPDLLQKDKVFQMATSMHERNLRIRQIIDELAPGTYDNVPRSGHGIERYAQDMKGMDSYDVPQFDQTGNIVMQRYSDTPPTMPAKTPM